MTIWFKVNGDGRAGFTSDPAQAEHDMHGDPIVAPGHVAAAVRRAAQERAAIMVDALMDDVWEELLNLMEEKFELEAQSEDDGRVNKSQPLRAVTRKINGISAALAIVEYNYLYKTEPGSAMNKIAQEAHQRYMATVEED